MKVRYCERICGELSLECSNAGVRFPEGRKGVVFGDVLRIVSPFFNGRQSISCMVLPTLDQLAQVSSVRHTKQTFGMLVGVKNQNRAGSTMAAGVQKLDADNGEWCEVPFLIIKSEPDSIVWEMFRSFLLNTTVCFFWV